MPILHAIVLGIVQGLTEYIPVSSTAHRIVVSQFLHGRPTDPHAFDTIIQFGTVVPVLIYRKLISVQGEWLLIREKKVLEIVTSKSE